MSSICNCPLCRHRRGEISDECMAWYIKGKIEVYASIPKSLLKKVDREDEREHVFLMQTWDDEAHDSQYFNELIERIKSAGKPVDPAWLQPERYVAAVEQKEQKELEQNDINQRAGEEET